MPNECDMSTPRTRSRSIAAPALALALAAVATLALAPQAGAGGPNSVGSAGAQRVQRTGTLLENHGDHLQGGAGHAEDAYSVQLPSGVIVALDRVPEGRAHGLVGRQVRVTGAERNGRLDVSDGSVVSADGSTGGSTTGTAAAIAPGVKTVAVVLVNFADDTRQPWTTAQARSVVFDGTSSVNTYYQDASDGQVSLSGDVFGYVTVTKDNVGCDWSQWGADARSQAIAAGMPLGNYTYTVYAWPRTTLCGWAGLGYLPGTSSYIDGYLDVRVVGHELGHNFGVHHASTMSCTDSAGAPIAISGTCSSNEYGDPYTIMGSSSRLHNNWHRAQLGWNMTTTTATTNGAYSLAPADAGSGVRLLRVPRGNDTFLNLEFRQTTGVFDTFSLTDPVTQGVSVRIAPGTNQIVQSQLIDATPTNPASFADSSLKAGRSLTDPVSGATISVLSVSAAGAEVTIDFGPDGIAPSAVSGPTASTTATSTTSSVTLQWGAATDNRGVVGYRVSRSGAALTTTTALTYTDATVTGDQSYTYGVEALDAAGNVGPLSSVTITAARPDSTAPTAVTGLTASANKGRTVTLRWNASTDAGGAVTYTISRSGRSWTSSTTSTTDKPGRGTFTYTVIARDAAGNSSVAATVTITVR